MRLIDAHDGLLFDLDGTLIRGSEAIPGAVEELRAAPTPYVYVTNNASRSPAQTAEHLASFGFPAQPANVITSAEAAVEMLRDQVPTGARVLIVGHQSFKELASAGGYEVVESADDHPAAVLQGLSKVLTWSDLAEGCLAIRAGAVWIASNVDTTLPSDRGFLPGNGALVAAMRAATGCEPLVAGKPAAGMLVAAAQRIDSTTPLVVGDRLDTDIAGAVAAGMPALLVLTGVSTVADLWRSTPAERPKYLAMDLSSLNDPENATDISQAPLPDCHMDGETLVITRLSASPEPAEAADQKLRSKLNTHLLGERDLQLVRGVLKAGWDGGALRLCTADTSIGERLLAAGLPVD